MRAYLLVVLALALALAFGSGCGRDSDHAFATRIVVAAQRLPGLQIVVEHRGEIVLDAQYGFADVENHVPVTADSVFCIGSISKQFGAAAIMQLVEAGKLSLDDKLAAFYPAFPRAERITIRDLLRHTSGIADFEYTGPWPPVMSVTRTQDELIAMFATMPPLFEPNTRWGYSTSNYVLLGEIIAKVSKQPLRDYMQQHIFARAGLEHTRFCDTYDLIANRARGYETKHGKLVPAEWQLYEQFSVGGGICSTARDLIEWQKALESGRVVSPASYAQMIAPTPLVDGTPTGYGLGLFSSEFAGRAVISHEGNVSGFSSVLLHVLDEDVRLASVTNHRQLGPPAWDAVAGLLAIPPPSAVPIGVAELTWYAGKSMPYFTGTLRFAVENNGLVTIYEQDGKANPSVPLVHVGNHAFEHPVTRMRVQFEVSGDRVRGVEVIARGMSTFARF